MCSRIFFSFRRMLSFVTFEYFFLPAGLGQSHSSTVPYCSSICLPVTRLARSRSRLTLLFGLLFSSEPFVLAIIFEGEAINRFDFCALEDFNFANFISGQGILPDWQAVKKVQINITTQ